MPFLVYDFTVDKGRRTYSLMRSVALGGRGGPVAALASAGNAHSVVPFPWKATRGEVLRALRGDPDHQELIVDLKPTVAGNVSLYRLLCVWGFSYEAWTPVAVLLQTLFSDLAHARPAEFKQRFTDAEADGSLVGEFLYLQGGVKTGSWNWGRVGSVNGALLWPDAFEYLSNALRQAFRNPL